MWSELCLSYSPFAEAPAVSHEYYSPSLMFHQISARSVEQGASYTVCANNNVVVYLNVSCSKVHIYGAAFVILFLNTGIML